MQNSCTYGQQMRTSFHFHCVHSVIGKTPRCTCSCKHTPVRETESCAQRTAPSCCNSLFSSYSFIHVNMTVIVARLKLVNCCKQHVDCTTFRTFLSYKKRRRNSTYGRFNIDMTFEPSGWPNFIFLNSCVP